MLCFLGHTYLRGRRLTRGGWGGSVLAGSEARQINSIFFFQSRLLLLLLQRKVLFDNDNNGNNDKNDNSDNSDNNDNNDNRVIRKKSLSREKVEVEFDLFGNSCSHYLVKLDLWLL